MLKSRHIFIQKGSLSSNDNGRKKFNSSEIRHMDEKYLESPEVYGDSLPFCMGREEEKVLRSGLSRKISLINDVLRDIKREEKVLIYGGGELAQFLLRHADMGHLNLIGIVDRGRNPVFDIEVKDTTYENIALADVILVTPHYAASEIKNYLQSLELHSRIICLSDLCDGVILNGHENIWAPDFEQTPGVDTDFDPEELGLATKKINRNSPYFVSVKTHTVYPRQFVYSADVQRFEEKTALVIQGPVVYQQDFTYESIRLYHKNYPKMQIVLSVWEEENVERVYPDIKDYNVEIVYSQRPKNRGYQNINLQLTTTYEGIAKAKELGREYVFKTRTDMRYYSPDMVALMHWYMSGFSSWDDTKQKARLVIFPPRYDYFFFIRDFFMFGHVDDMIDYWDTDRSFSDQYVGESAETMLGIRYAKYIGRFIENDLSDIDAYRKVLAQVFAVVDDKLLDYIWYKYFYNKLWEHEYHYNTFQFSDWLSEQKNSEEVFPDEKFEKEDPEKKQLLYITDVRMATRYLQTAECSDICLRLVRGMVTGGDINRFANGIFTGDGILQIDVVKEEDYEWADEILFLSKDSISVSVIKNLKESWKEKVKIIENPYIDICKTYTNSNGDCYEIWDRFVETKDTQYQVEGRDIPFVFEPRMSSINKRQKEEYRTYSFARKDLSAGIYFDEKVIEKQKNYHFYNKDIKVILYGASDESDFVKNTKQMMQYIYGTNCVTFVKFDEGCVTFCEKLKLMCKEYMQEEKSYILMPADVRVISPYMVKLFESIQKGDGERLGIVQPMRVGRLMSKAVIYAKKEQIAELADMLMSSEWYQYLIRKCTVIDYEMLNVLDCEREVYSCKDKPQYIGFTEWISQGRKVDGI